MQPLIVVMWRNNKDEATIIIYTRLEIEYGAVSPVEVHHMLLRTGALSPDATP